jgi:hypothetical protein
MSEKKEALEWAVFPQSSATKSIVPDSDHDYDMFDAKIGEALLYGERTWGINLVWGDPKSSNNVRFARQNGKRDPIKYKEPVAINVRKGGWLVYKKRDYGINLGWSDSPRFEWRLDGGDPKDKVVLPGLIALHNSVENDWLFYAPREFGINLRWTADADKGSPILDAATAGNLLKKYWGKIF